MSWRGIFTGTLLLAGLEAVVSSNQSGERFGNLITAAGSILSHFLDPTVPAIPDLSK